MYLRAFHSLRLPLSENNDLFEDITITVKSPLGEIVFQVQSSEFNNLDEEAFLCVTTINHSPSEKIIEIYTRLKDSSLDYNPLDLADAVGEFDQNVNKLSNIKNLPRFKSIGSHLWIDDSFWNYIFKLKSLLDKSCTRLVDLICWRFGFTGRKSVLPSELSSLQWSFDKENWFQFPLVGVFQDPYKFDVETDVKNFQQVKKYFELGIVPSLGMEIFHQAWSLRENYPQVSLVTAMSATEVEIKRFLSRFALIKPEELTLNAAIKRIRQPVLVNKISFIFPRKIVDNLDKGRRIRNDLVHEGDQQIEQKDLELILISVRDLLALIDLCYGYNWSKSFLSEEIRKII